MPEPGRHILRGYGLYAHTKTPELDRARNLFHQPPFAPPARLTWQAYYQRRQPQAGAHRCTVCGAPLVRSRLLTPSKGPPARRPLEEKPVHA